MATRRRTIPRAPTLDPAEVAASVEEYLANRSMRERSEYHEGRIKKDLMALLEVAGDPIEPHKQILELDTPISWTRYGKDGKPKQTKVKGIERRERVSTTLDDDKALALLARKGLTGQCTQTVVVVDEDAILAANYAGQITDKELAALYSESSTFAFYPTEDTES